MTHTLSWCFSMRFMNMVCFRNTVLSQKSERGRYPVGNVAPLCTFLIRNSLSLSRERFSLSISKLSRHIHHSFLSHREVARANPCINISTGLGESNGHGHYRKRPFRILLRSSESSNAIALLLRSLHLLATCPGAQGDMSFRSYIKIK